MSSIAELQKQVREGKDLRITGHADNTDQEFIKNFINNEFFALDSRAFREEYSKNIPDVNFDANWRCGACQWMGPVDLPVTVNFFWPSR